MEFPHVNQHSGPLVSLLSNGAKGEEGGAAGHLVFRGDSHWWQRDTNKLCMLRGEESRRNPRFRNLHSTVGSLDVIFITKVGVLQRVNDAT